jgi:hypothetical protein
VADNGTTRGMGGFEPLPNRKEQSTQFGRDQDSSSPTRVVGLFLLCPGFRVPSEVCGNEIGNALGPRLQWELHYTDDKNYLLFSMDENFFYRSLVRNGQQVDTAQFAHKTDKKQFRSLQIRVSADEIVHEIREGNGWVTLDTWNQPGTELSAGKFGFFIPGKDQVALSNFRHYADLTSR